jgi:hypothetical protein
MGRCAGLLVQGSQLWHHDGRPHLHCR